jgi:Protein of function (DUF2518)
MSTTELLQTAARWSGYFTLFCAALMILGLFLKWGVRFRLVGITGFMTVLTVGIFALSLSFYIRPSIPGAVRFARVYDTGTASVVISVPPEITETQLQATMQQAASDLYSMGRLAQGADKMTIRVRTVLHPKPGVSLPVYVGEVQRSLTAREDSQMTIRIDPDKLALLPKSTAPKPTA